MSAPSASLPLPRPGSAAAWVAAMRPRTLPAAAVPVVVGTALAAAEGGARPLPALAALLGALLIQVGTNFANDLFDAKKGADGPDRKGPPRMVATGRIRPGAMRAGIAVAFGLASLCGLYLAAVAGWPVIAIGLLSLAAGLAYTGGPWPLGYHGLGDLFVMLFFGFVAVGGTVYVQRLALPAEALVLGAGVGALSTALLVVNNLRDLDEDRASGKRTLAVRLGRAGTLLEHALLLLLAAAAAASVVRPAAPATLVALAPLPLFAVRHLALRRAREAAALVAELSATGGLLVLYGACLSAALLLGS